MVESGGPIGRLGVGATNPSGNAVFDFEDLISRDLHFTCTNFRQPRTRLRRMEGVLILSIVDKNVPEGMEPLVPALVSGTESGRSRNGGLWGPFWEANLTA